MVRRPVSIALFVAVVLALAVTPAIAYEATASYDVDQHARLVEGSSQAVYMWSAAGGDLKAARVSPSAGPAARTRSSPESSASGPGSQPVTGWT